VFAFLGFPRAPSVGWGMSLQNLPTGLFIRTHDDPVVRKEAEGVEGQGGQIAWAFAFQNRVVAVEPIDTLAMSV